MAKYIDADVLKRFRDDVISGKLDIHNEGDLIDLCPAADVAEFCPNCGAKMGGGAKE